MGYAYFDDRHSTLQTSYSFSNPEFTVQSRQFLSFGYNSWIVMEKGFSVDNVLRPGENVDLAQFNRFSFDYDTGSPSSTANRLSD